MGFALWNFDAIADLARALSDFGRVNIAAVVGEDFALEISGWDAASARPRHAAALSFGAEGCNGLCPFVGGTLDLHGVFGGIASFVS